MERLNHRRKYSNEAFDMLDKRIEQALEQTDLTSEDIRGEESDNNQSQTEYIPSLQNGGMPYPQTLSQESIKFVSETPYMPIRLKKKAWGFASHQIGLTQIRNQLEQKRMEGGQRAALQTLMWNDPTLTPVDFANYELHLRTGSLKAVGGIERRLLTPQISEQNRTETVTETERKKAGLLDRLLGKN
jgi:hypothetical protein